MSSTSTSAPNPFNVNPAEPDSEDEEERPYDDSNPQGGGRQRLNLDDLFDPDDPADAAHDPVDADPDDPADAAPAPAAPADAAPADPADPDDPDDPAGAAYTILHYTILYYTITSHYEFYFYFFAKISCRTV